MSFKISIYAATLVFLACSGPRAFTRGEYADPNAIELLSDQFNENDLQLIAKKMTASLTDSAVVAAIPGRPVVVVGKFRNKTSEHIDMESLVDKIRVELQKKNRFAFVNKVARDEISEEYDYQQSGYVRSDQAKGPGKQAGADYLLTGSIASIVQEVGADKIVYYKMTMELTNLTSSVIEWTDEKELRKKYRKQGVSW